MVRTKTSGGGERDKIAKESGYYLENVVRVRQRCGKVWSKWPKIWIRPRKCVENREISREDIGNLPGNVDTAQII